MNKKLENARLELEALDPLILETVLKKIEAESIVITTFSQIEKLIPGLMNKRNDISKRVIHAKLEEDTDPTIFRPEIEKRKIAEMIAENRDYLGSFIRWLMQNIMNKSKGVQAEELGRANSFPIYDFVSGSSTFHSGSNSITTGMNPMQDNNHFQVTLYEQMQKAEEYNLLLTIEQEKAKKRKSVTGFFQR